MCVGGGEVRVMRKSGWTSVSVGIAVTLLIAASSLGATGVASAADPNPTIEADNQLQPGAAPAPGSSQPSPHQQAPQGQPLGLQPYATFPLPMALGPYGYFEVTAAGSLVLYPAWTSIPAVMQTILAMMGPASLVGRRGFYQITPNGAVIFFLPPGSMPGMFAPTGYGSQPIVSPYGAGFYGMPGMVR